MKNNLADLNNHLFMMLETLEDDDLDDAALQKEISRAKAVCSVSTQILKVAGVQISALKAAESIGLLDRDMPELIANKVSDRKKLPGAAK